VVVDQVDQLIIFTMLLVVEEEDSEKVKMLQ